MRKGRTEAEIEYENVDILLQKRKARKASDGKQHLLDNLRAKQGMRDLREHGRVRCQVDACFHKNKFYILIHPS